MKMWKVKKAKNKLELEKGSKQDSIMESKNLQNANNLGKIKLISIMLIKLSSMLTL